MNRNPARGSVSEKNGQEFAGKKPTDKEKAGEKGKSGEKGGKGGAVLGDINDDGKKKK